MEKRLTSIELKLLKRLGFDHWEIYKAQNFFEKGIDCNLSLLKKHLLTFFQFIRFGIAGTVAAFLHTGTLILLVELFHVYPVAASAAGFMFAVMSSYTINYNITFSTRNSHAVYFPKFFLVCLIGLLINTSIMYLAIDVFGLWYLWGQLCAIVVVPAINFVLNRFWTFRY